MRVPAPHATEFRGAPTATEGRKHHPDDLAKQLLLAVQAACDCAHQVGWQTHVLQGLVQGLRRPLRLAPITLQAFTRLGSTALSGFGLLFGVSFAGEHSVLLQPVVLSDH